jgi:hypothetical protein
VTITFIVGSGASELFVRGRVRSPEQKCVWHRGVNFIGERGRNPQHGGAGDLTFRDGRFSLLLRHDPTPREHYRIKARRSFHEDGSLKCKADVKRFRTPS